MAIRVLYVCAPDWAAAGDRLDELLAGPDFRVLKKSARTLVGIVRIDGVELFVKRVATGSWVNGVIARFCGSRARKTIRGVEILKRSGFYHPILIAAFERYRHASVQASYVILEYLHRPKILSRVALADGRDFRWRQRFSEELAGSIRRLHDAGCYTRDLQETNLMVEAEHSGLKVFFTDLEDFRRLNVVPRRLRLLNLIHLDRSIGRFVSRAHRLRFLYSYFGNKPGRAEARALVSHLHRIHLQIGHRNGRRQRSGAIVMPSDAGNPNHRYFGRHFT